MKGLKMKYFVLKPNGNDVYAEASRAAMNQYARLIEHKNPKLAKELRDWAFDELSKTNKFKDFK